MSRRGKGRPQDRGRGRTATPPGRGSRFSTWVERLVQAVAAGAAAVLVLRWAGIAPRTCLIAGACAFVLVPVAAWIASTVPGPPAGSSRERDDRRR